MSVCASVCLSVPTSDHRHLYCREGESDDMEERVYQYIQEAKDLYHDVIMYKVGSSCTVAGL